MEVKVQNVAKNTTWLTTAYIAQKALAFIYFTIVARFIGATDIGVYTFAISLTTIFSVFIDLGFASVLIREAAKFKDKANDYLNNIISVKLVLAIIAYLGVFIVINLLGKPQMTQIMVYLAGLVMILDSFTLAFFAVFRAYQNLKYEAIGIAINQVLILLVGLIGLVLNFPLYILILALLAGSIFEFIYALSLLKFRLKFKFKLIWDKDLLAALFKIALPFALAGIFVRVYSYLDQILLSVLIGDKSLGWYSVPFKITYAFQFLPAAFAAAIYPAMSNYFLCDKTKLKRIFEQSMFILIFLAIPAAIGIACLADKIILTLYTDEFSPSILTLQIMIFALIPMFLNYPSGSVLNACDKQGRNTFNMGLTMILNIILNLILIPRYQHYGAALAALLSLSLLFILNIFIVPKIIKYDQIYLLKKALKTLIASFVMAIVILIFKDYLNFIFLIIIGGAVYLTIMFIIKGFTKENINYLFQAIFKKTPYEENTLDHN